MVVVVIETRYSLVGYRVSSFVGYSRYLSPILTLPQGNMKQEHVLLLRRVAEEAVTLASEYDHLVEIYEEGENTFSFRMWDRDELDEEEALEYSVIAVVRLIDIHPLTNEPMLAVSVDGEHEVVIEANGRVLAAIMYAGV